MNSAFSLSLLALLCSAVATAVTITLGHKVLRASELFTAAASGALIMLAIAHLAPEAASRNAHAPILIGVGLAAAMMLHLVFQNRGTGKLNELIVLSGVALHSFLDGVILSTVEHAGKDTLLASTPGMLLHEIPEAIFCYLLVWRLSRSALFAAITAVFVAGVTTVLGAIASESLIAGASMNQLGGLMALSVGLLLYSGGSMLLSHSGDRMLKRGVSAGAGAVVFIATMSFAPSHEHSSSPDLHRDHAHSANEDQPDFSAFRYSSPDQPNNDEEKSSSLK